MRNNELQKEYRLNGRYEIYRTLGHGGFGITYAAADTLLEQDVVIKEYFPQHLITERTAPEISCGADSIENFAKGKDRFLAEAQTLASLFEVPGVVKVLDYFEANNTAYIVMEYVKGVTLLDWMESRDELFSFEEACNFLKPVIDALERVHKYGLLHRDISPDNIMVTEEGLVKLLDFGSAREFFMDNDREKTMTVLVKAGYAPPEQYMQKSKQGPWTDIYGLCAVIYEMITGTMPQSALDRQLADSLYAPSAYGAKIEADKEEALLTKGLALNADDRYRSVRRLREDFFGEVKIKRPAESRRKWTIIALVAAVLIAASVLLIPQDCQQGEPAAGSYDRGSQEYNDYIAFVEENAVSEESLPDGGGTVYQLTEDTVREWGQRSNRHSIDLTQGNLRQELEEKGYTLIFENSEEKYEVAIKPYGIIETEFCRTDIYKCNGTLEIRITYDVISEKVTGLKIIPDGNDDTDLGKMAADVYLILNAEAEESWQDVREYMTEAIGAEYSGSGEVISGYSFGEMSFLCVKAAEFESKGNMMLVMGPLWGTEYYWP